MVVLVNLFNDFILVGVESLLNRRHDIVCSFLGLCHLLHHLFASHLSRSIVSLDPFKTCQVSHVSLRASRRSFPVGAYFGKPVEDFLSIGEGVASFFCEVTRDEKSLSLPSVRFFHIFLEERPFLQLGADSVPNGSLCIDALDLTIDAR